MPRDVIDVRLALAPLQKAGGEGMAETAVRASFMYDALYASLKDMNQ
jgi:hypothetical protein